MPSQPGSATGTSPAKQPPSSTRTIAADGQRRRIRRATGELVAKRGYSGVSVELITRRARVSFKTFYKHYSNKEEGFADLFDVALAATEAQVRGALEESGAEWPERVAIAMRAFFEAILAEPLIARALLVEGPTAGPAMLERHDRIAAAFVPILLRGREYNPEAASLPETLEETLAGAVLWSAYQRLSFSETERIAELIPENVQLVLRPYIGEAEASRVAAAG